MPQPKDILVPRVQIYRTLTGDSPPRILTFEVQMDRIDCVTGENCVSVIPRASRDELFRQDSEGLLPERQSLALGHVKAAELFWENGELEMNQERLEQEKADLTLTKTESANLKAYSKRQSTKTIQKNAEAAETHKTYEKKCFEYLQQCTSRPPEGVPRIVAARWFHKRAPWPTNWLRPEAKPRRGRRKHPKEDSEGRFIAQVPSVDTVSRNFLEKDASGDWCLCDPTRPR